MSMDLPALLRFHRKHSGLTQQQLAELAGVGKNLVYDLEGGKSTVRWANLLKVLEVLNIRIEFQSPLMASFRRDGDDADG